MAAPRGYRLKHLDRQTIRVGYNPDALSRLSPRADQYLAPEFPHPAHRAIDGVRAEPKVVEFGATRVGRVESRSGGRVVELETTLGARLLQVDVDPSVVHRPTEDHSEPEAFAETNRPHKAADPDA